MTRSSGFLWLVVAGLGLTTSCIDYRQTVGSCPDGNCSTDDAEEKLCPLDTHVCVPRVGGGWDGVVRWRGNKDKTPTKCPAAASNISFWGEEVLSPNMPPDTPAQMIVGCGFIEGGVCASGEDEVDRDEDLAHSVCAPRINDWPACIVADSTRVCPPTYTAQTLVGSDEINDLEWTVCCLEDPPGTSK